MCLKFLFEDMEWLNIDSRIISVTMYFTDGSPLVNSHCGLVPSTTNSLYTDTPHHDGAHVVQMSTHDNEITVDNLVTLSPTETGVHEHSCEYLLIHMFAGKMATIRRNSFSFKL